ncbi:tetratricopeptide repeat protein [Pseudomonas mendocina]|jgi:tetratricopeptide (TPR) repeat protein|uniref:tetratricopeptide repeat protein n=1 Tax=Ectopseudomonas mendocina TaxID=300 RepID=UPI0023D9A239|nr:tetratricopeptide repeat protein [Pseudomonas mendocina]MDF2077103.1 tetratricopeptide repeat protein [Pseudomonas mendocina]
MRVVILFLICLLPHWALADESLSRMIERYNLEKTGDYLHKQSLAFLSHEIGVRLLESQDYKAAIPYFQTALDIDQTLDPDAPLLGGRWTYLGQAYVFDGQFQKGLESLRAALEVDERHYPAEHLNIGIANGNLGWAMIRSRQYQKANEHLQIACSIFTKQLGEQDPQTLDCHKKLDVTLKYL